MFECRLNEFVVEILQQYNAALGLNNPPPTAQLLNAMASFVKQNTIKSLKLSFDGGNSSLTARAEFNDNKFSESTVDLSSLKYDLDVYDLAEKLEGSDTIVVDINEDGDKVEIHLDSDVVAKIDRALLLPVFTPTEFELVGVNEQKEQVRVKLGEGVEYDAETQTIKATASGGTKLYRHLIKDISQVGSPSFVYDTIEVISTSNVPITDDQTFQNIFNNYCVSATIPYYGTIFSLFSYFLNQVAITYSDRGQGNEVYSAILNVENIVDTVTEM